jgi:hypothetical protein
VPIEVISEALVTFFSHDNRNLPRQLRKR